MPTPCTQVFATYMSATVQTLLVVHAPLSAKAFLYFDCDWLTPTHAFVREDYAVECFSPQWNAFLPLALVPSIFLLPWLAVQLLRTRQSLESRVSESRRGGDRERDRLLLGALLRSQCGGEPPGLPGA